jgi:hypothetical protein
VFFIAVIPAIFPTLASFGLLPSSYRKSPIRYPEVLAFDSGLNISGRNPETRGGGAVKRELNVAGSAVNI